jgi:protein TonB
MFSSESRQAAPGGWLQRVFGASGASLIFHIVLLMLAVTWLNTEPSPEAHHVRPMRTELIVRLPMPGDSGGGGGRPGQSSAATTSIPATRPPDPVPVAAPPPDAEPPPLPQLDARVMTNSGDLLQFAGQNPIGVPGPAGGGRGRGLGDGDGDGAKDGSRGNTGGGPRRPGDGVLMPVPLQQPRPNYTVPAMRAKTSGEVILEAVVEANGTVSSLKVLKGLPFGLNEEAMKAARQWLFKPAMAEGKPVPIIVTIVLEFNLR